MNAVKKFFGKAKRKAKAIIVSCTSVLTVAALSITACAEEAAGSNTLVDIVTTAGNSLSEQFAQFVQALIPVLLAIAFSGLGLFAIVYLFKMAKAFFAKAAG